MTKPVAKKTRRGNPAGPPKRGRRGHPTVKAQAGFEEWLDELLAKEPDLTHDELLDRMKGTGYSASRSSLNRWVIEQKKRQREMADLLKVAKALSSEDTEDTLALEKATAKLATTRMFQHLLEDAGTDVGEAMLDLVSAFARLQSSSASRERAATVVHGKYKAALRSLQRGFEEQLRNDPHTLKKVLAMLQKVFGEEVAAA